MVMKTNQLQNSKIIPAGYGVKKLGPKEGRTIEVGGARLTWKARGADNILLKYQKKRRDLQRRTRGSASLPPPAKWLGPIIPTVHTNDSTPTKKRGSPDRNQHSLDSYLTSP
jgi:hypothetical protein